MALPPSAVFTIFHDYKDEAGQDAKQQETRGEDQSKAHARGDHRPEQRFGQRHQKDENEIGDDDRDAEKRRQPCRVTSAAVGSSPFCMYRSWLLDR
jgi:hypothetical protein